MLRVWLLSLATTITFSLPTHEGRPDCTPSDTVLTDLSGFRLYSLVGPDTVLLLDSAISVPGRRCTVTVAVEASGSPVLALAYDRAGNSSCPAVLAPTASVDAPEPHDGPVVPVAHRCGGRP